MTLKNLYKVFIDTNVWFSAFYRSENAEKIVKAHVDKKIKAVIDEQVLNELVKNIKEKIPAAAKPLETFLKAAPPVIIKDNYEIYPAVKSLADAKDRVILQAAITAKAKYFVTGNIRHFSASKIKSQFGLLILSPVQAVKLLSL